MKLRMKNNHSYELDLQVSPHEGGGWIRPMPGREGVFELFSSDFWEPVSEPQFVDVTNDCEIGVGHVFHDFDLVCAVARGYKMHKVNIARGEEKPRHAFFISKDEP